MSVQATPPGSTSCICRRDGTLATHAEVQSMSTLASIFFNVRGHAATQPHPTPAHRGSFVRFAARVHRRVVTPASIQRRTTSIDSDAPLWAEEVQLRLSSSIGQRSTPCLRAFRISKRWWWISSFGQWWRFRRNSPSLHMMLRSSRRIAVGLECDLRQGNAEMDRASLAITVRPSRERHTSQNLRPVTLARIVGAGSSV